MKDLSRFSTVFAGLVIATLGGIAPRATAEVKLDAVEYKAGDTKLKGWIAYDDDVKGKRPGVIVVHEWWGLNDYAKTRARMLAEAGYVAFAADMYGDGKQTEHPKEAGEWAGAAAPTTRCRSSLQRGTRPAQREFPRRSRAHCRHRLLLRRFSGAGMAMSGADLDGVVTFHAGLPTAPATGNIKAKILVCHGAADEMATAEQIETFQKNLAAAGADWEFISYGNAKHGFTNPDADKHGIPGLAYNKEADKRSWKTALDFLAEATK